MFGRVNNNKNDKTRNHGEEFYLMKSIARSDRRHRFFFFRNFISSHSLINLSLCIFSIIPIQLLHMNTYELILSLQSVLICKFHESTIDNIENVNVNSKNKKMNAIDF